MEEKYLKCQNCGSEVFTTIDEEYELSLNSSYKKNACECVQCVDCGNIQSTQEN